MRERFRSRPRELRVLKDRGGVGPHSKRPHATLPRRRFRTRALVGDPGVRCVPNSPSGVSVLAGQSGALWHCFQRRHRRWALGHGRETAISSRANPRAVWLTVPADPVALVGDGPVLTIRGSGCVVWHRRRRLAVDVIVQPAGQHLSNSVVIADRILVAAWCTTVLYTQKSGDRVCGGHRSFVWITCC